MKILFIIYVDMDSLRDKIDTYSNPEKSSITKINKHAASGYSLFMHCSFDVTKNKHYSDKNSMKSLCKDLKENATKQLAMKIKR